MQVLPNSNLLFPLECRDRRSIMLRGELTDDPEASVALDPEITKLDTEIADCKCPSLLEDCATQLVLKLAAENASDLQVDRTIAFFLAKWIGVEDVDVLALVDEEHPQHCVAPVIKYFLDTYPLTWKRYSELGTHEDLATALHVYEDVAIRSPSQIRWSIEPDLDDEW